MATSQRNMTRADLVARISEFVAHIKNTVEPDPRSGRAMFPEFVVTDDIRHALREVQKALGENRLGDAYELLEGRPNGVVYHFSCKQAAYAKLLQKDLRDDFNALRKDKGDENLLQSAWEKIRLYEEFVNQKFFDLSVASKAYWAAIDTLNAVDNELKKRQDRAREEAEKRAAAKRAQDEAEAKRAREVEMAHAKAAAAKLDELFATL